LAPLPTLHRILEDLDISRVETKGKQKEKSKSKGNQRWMFQATKAKAK
jgi:hypothetical protein